MFTRRRIGPHLLFAGIAALAAYSTAAQTTVRGTVRDSLTRQPLQAASVVLQQAGGFRYGTATDGDGYFVIPRVEEGRYDLSVTFVGYQPYRRQVDTRSGDQPFLHVVMVPSEQKLGEVLVEAESEQGITSVKAGLQVIRPADIQRVPVLGASGDLAAYLQTVPGIAVQGDRGGQVFVRGGSTDQNLALLDGMPVYQPFHIVSFYSAFPEEIVDHADVYTGAFGAAYSTRLSSVMDVKMRNGNKERIAGSVSVAPFLSGVRLEGPVVRERLSFVGSVRQSLVEELTPNLYGQRLPYRFGDRFGKLHAFVGASHTISVTGLSTSDRGDIAGSLTTFDGEYSPTSPEVEVDREVAWENRVIGGRYAFRSARLPLLVEAHASASRSLNEVGPEDAPDRTASIESRDASLVATIFTRFGEFTGGGRWRESDLDFELGGQFQDLEAGSIKATELSAFVESVHTLDRGRITIKPGLNVYALPDRNEVRPEPRLRVTWSPPVPRGAHTAHAGFGGYHQLITALSDERDVGNVFTAWVPAADSLALPASWHVVAGWSSTLDAGFSLALEGFVKTFSSLSVPEFTPFPSFTTSLQEADGTAHGIDIRVETDGRPFVGGSILSGYAGYSLSNVEYRTDDFAYNPPQHRSHQLNVMVRAERNGVGLTLQWQYGSGYPYTKSAGFDVWQYLTPNSEVSQEPGATRVLYLEPFGGRQPNYERVDLWLDKTVEFSRGRATLRAGIVNLLNRDNLFYYDLFTLRRVDQMPLIPSVGFRLEML